MQKVFTKTGVFIAKIIHIPEDKYKKLMKYLEDNDMIFSKWVRRLIVEAIDKIKE